jgi:hypothetical protein
MDTDAATEFYEERAAIMEYDGGFKRYDAEFHAVCLTLRYCGRTGAEVPTTGFFWEARNAVLDWDEEQGRGVVVTASRVMKWHGSI